MKIFSIVLVAFCFCCAVLQTGCTLAACGLGVATMVNDMKVRQQEDFAQYRAKVEADNASRAKAGLPMEKPLSFRQWTRQQG